MYMYMYIYIHTHTHTHMKIDSIAGDTGSDYSGFCPDFRKGRFASKTRRGASHPGGAAMPKPAPFSSAEPAP